MSDEGPDQVFIVYTLYGDPDAAEKAARDMVMAGLAACANILAPCRSSYMWNGALEMEAEHPVLFKTSEKQREALMARLGRDHPYTIPAILSWEAMAAPSYAQWIGDVTGPA